MRTIIINNPGPQGTVGPQGVAGPSGSTQPFNNVSGSIWATTSSLQVTGSFIVSGSSTFTNIGPAVFSGSVNATSGVTMSSAIVSGDVTVLGTASINVLQINTTINSTGSNILGDAANDTQTLYGSVIVPTGSLTVSGSVRFRGSGSSSTTSALTVQNSSGTALLNTRDDGLVTIGASGWLGVGETSRYLYRALNATGIFTIANDSTVGSSVDMFGSSHATLPNLIRVTAPASLQITGSLNVSNTARFNNNFDLYRSDGVYMMGMNNAAAVIDINPSNSSVPTFRVRGASGILLHIKANEDKVGINTTTPSAMLHVKGSGTTSATTSLQVENTNASASMVVLDNGSVGIGTTSPTFRLEVQGGDVRFANGLSIGNPATSVGWTFSSNTLTILQNGFVGVDIAGNRSFNITNTAFSTYYFKVAETTGNILIGTPTDAGFKLDVNGTARVQGNLTISNFAGITSGNNGIGFETFRTIFSTTANTLSNQYAFNFDDGGGSNVGTSGTTGRFQLSSRFAPTSGTAVYNTFLLNATINQTGGANGITRGLFINPTLTAAADFRAIETTSGSISFNHGSTPLIFASTNGNVGIGTGSAAAYKFQVRNGDIALDFNRFLRGGFDNNWSTINLYNGSTGDMEINVFNTNWYLRHNANATFAGNVGIGLSGSISPRLHVKGSGATSATTALRVENTNASASLVVLDNGNVGIGIITPTASLHIKGATTSSLSSSLRVENSSASTSLVINDDGAATFRTTNNTSGTTTPYNWYNGGNTLMMSIRDDGDVSIPRAVTSGLFQQDFSVYGYSGYLVQRFAIGAAIAANNSSILELVATNRGFLPPRTNTTASISSPAQGLMTYLTGSTNEGLYYYNSGSQVGWHKVITNAGSQIITGSLTISGSTPSLQLGTSTFVGDFTNPVITFGSNSNGIYLDSNRINFKAGGVFAGSFSSDGYITNQIQIRGTLFNDLTTAMFVPYRLNAIGLSSGLGGDSTGAVALITSGSTRLYISSSGNVGIGTDTPTQKLEVSGAARITTLGINGFDSIFNQRLYVNGNILIEDGGGIGNTNSITREWLKFSSAIGLQLATNGTERIRVGLNGNVLIGTTTDAGFKLDVNGTLRVIGATTLGTTSASNTTTIATNGSSNVLNVTNTAGTFVFGVDSAGGYAQPSTANRGMWFYNSSASAYIGAAASGCIAINTTSPNASAILDVVSTTKGFLPPRMTNAQRLAIATPAVGLMVYCTDATEGLYIYKSTGWTFIA